MRVGEEKTEATRKLCKKITPAEPGTTEEENLKGGMDQVSWDTLESHKDKGNEP